MNRRRKFLVVSCVGAGMMIWLMFFDAGEERRVSIYAGEGEEPGVPVYAGEGEEPGVPVYVGEGEER